MEAHPESSKELIAEVLERNALKRKNWAFPAEQTRKEKAWSLMGHQGYGACPAWMKDDADAVTTGRAWPARARERSFVGLMAAFSQRECVLRQDGKAGRSKTSKSSVKVSGGNEW